MVSNLAPNHMSDQWNWTTAKWDCDLLITGVNADRIGQHGVQKTINQNYDKIWGKNVKHFHKIKEHSTWWNAKHQCVHMTCSVHLHMYNMWTDAFTDQYQYLSNCPPTPPLTQQQSIDNNLRLMLGWGKGRWAFAQILILIQNLHVFRTLLWSHCENCMLVVKASWFP